MLVDGLGLAIGVLSLLITLGSSISYANPRGIVLVILNIVGTG
jgi:hypothetical protein